MSELCLVEYTIDCCFQSNTWLVSCLVEYTIDCRFQSNTWLVSSSVIRRLKKL